VSRPTYVGGLGFGFKWNMGWMHDTLAYFEHDPIHRSHHHHELTFSLVYAWNENFILPLSHDEVVHGKRSLLAKMPGDRWQQLANLRSLLAYMWAHPGKKLVFMGAELANPWEWTEADELPWWLLEHSEHAGVRDLVRDLNAAYLANPALWQIDFSHEGFRWLEPNDAANNALAFMRLATDEAHPVVCVANLSPVPREGYRLGVPLAGSWTEIVNTDSTFYGGSGLGNLGEVVAEKRAWHEQPYSLELTLPPLAVLWLRPA
jgi:1,4-alpha-glucan branching enzyme